MPRGHVARPAVVGDEPGREQLGGDGELGEGEHRTAARRSPASSSSAARLRKFIAVSTRLRRRARSADEQVEHVEADTGAGPFERGVGREAADDVGLAGGGVRAAGRSWRAGAWRAHPGEVGVGADDEDQVLRLEPGVHEGGHEQVVVAESHVDQRCHHEGVLLSLS